MPFSVESHPEPSPLAAKELRLLVEEFLGAFPARVTAALESDKEWRSLAFCRPNQAAPQIDWGNAEWEKWRVATCEPLAKKQDPMMIELDATIVAAATQAPAFPRPYLWGEMERERGRVAARELLAKNPSPETLARNRSAAKDNGYYPTSQGTNFRDGFLEVLDMGVPADPPSAPAKPTAAPLPSRALGPQHQTNTGGSPLGDWR